MRTRAAKNPPAFAGGFLALLNSYVKAHLYMGGARIIISLTAAGSDDRF